MPWSIFTQGGGQGAAVTWAQDLESGLGVPQSAANTQFIYDWELAEGGGGKYNPLNQGPVPGHPELTTTGQQYGGGAADYASWQAGLQGSVDYINMPAYSGIKAALARSDYGAAEHALWASPWAASHYGYGSGWPTAIPPAATPLGTGGGNVSLTGIHVPGTGITIPTPGDITKAIENALNPIHWIEAAFGPIKEVLMRLGLILLGGIIVVIGIMVLVKTSGNSSSSDMASALKELVTKEKESRETVVETTASQSNESEEQIEAPGRFNYRRRNA